jgi:hypothetical protein
MVFAFSFTSGTRAQQPLSIAQQGYFFVGGKLVTVNGRKVMSAAKPMANSRFPRKNPAVPDRYHSGRGADRYQLQRHTGRPGFLRRGYTVYIVEQPGRRRSGYQPESDGPHAYPNGKNLEDRFTAPERAMLWPQAKLHTQWPGTGLAGDPIFDQFYASQVPFVLKPEVTQAANRDAGVKLLDKIGPAIVLTHSQSGPYGWALLDARPTLVKALMQVEPTFPPVHDVEFIGTPDYFRDGSVVRRGG